ncbi:hypothetical protein JL721_11940 [Aureococcus anophagefferens]|nr:hypothetical protein JL721_11940 [Aureococcus anophagefferens]
MAAPRFRLRTGAPDWAKITAVDVDDVLETGSAGDVLSDLVDDLAFCKVVPPELRKVGHDASATMVGEFRDVALGIASAARAAGVDTAKWLRSLQDDGGAYEDDSEVMGSYGAARGRAWACAQCGKAFVNREYLEQHIRRKHGGSLAASGDAGLVAIARCFEAVARGPRPEASRRELLDFLQRGGHLEAIFGAARSEAERAVAEGTVAALLGDASADACVGPADLGDFVAELRRCRSVALGALRFAGGDLRRRRRRPACCSARTSRRSTSRACSAAGLPAIAEAGCVVALSRAGQRVAETPPAVGSREPTWLTSSHGATVAVPLAADEQRRERGLFVEVFAGACLVGVAHVHARSLLYDGLLRVKLRPDDDEFPGAAADLGFVELRCRAAARVRLENVEVFGLGAAPPGAPFLEARWRGGAGSAPSVVWRSAAAVRASRRPDSFDLVAEHPLPLGLPFARRHAVLDVFALFVDDDGTEASCGDAVAVAAGLGTRSPRAASRRVRRGVGDAGPARRRELLAAGGGARRGFGGALPRGARPPDLRPAAELAMLDANASHGPLAPDAPGAAGAALEAFAGAGKLADAVDGASTDVAFFRSGAPVVVDADGDVDIRLTRATDGACVARGVLAPRALSAARLLKVDLAKRAREATWTRAAAALRCRSRPPQRLRARRALLEGDALEVEAELDGVVVGSAALARAGDSFAGAGNLRLELPVEADGARRLALRVYDGAGGVCGARGPGRASYAVSVSVGGNALGSTAPAFPVSSPAGGGRASVAWYDRFDLAVPWGADGEGGAVSLELVRVAGDGTRTSVGAAALAGSAAALAAAPGVGEATLGDARVEYHVAVTSFADAADLAVADRRALDAAIDGLEARPNLAHRVVGALDLLRDAAEDPPALVA